MENTCNIIKNLLANNQSLSDDFGPYSKIYLHTTEDIKNFLMCFDLTDKEILTVAGSGDQVLNSYLMGAKNVTCFDINPLAFTQVKLKRAAVCSLSYEDYLSFLFLKDSSDYSNILDYRLFENLKPYLDDDTNQLFDYLYSNFNSKQILDLIYYRFTHNIDLLKRMNSYLEEDNYYRLSNILKEKEINFIESDITNLNKILDSKYDMILLSNISSSIEKIFPNEPLKNFKRIIHSLSKYVNKNGAIQIGYIYDYYRSRQDEIFSQHSKRKEVFDSSEFQTIFVESYRYHSESDAVITYYKRK